MRRDGLAAFHSRDFDLRSFYTSIFDLFSCRQRGRRVSGLLFQDRRDRRRDGRRSSNGRQRLSSSPHANSAYGPSSPHASSAGGTRQRRRRQAGGRSRRETTADKIVAEAEKWAERATKEAADEAREAADKAAQALSSATDAAKKWWEEVMDWFAG